MSASDRPSQRFSSFGLRNRDRAEVCESDLFFFGVYQPFKPNHEFGSVTHCDGRSFSVSGGREGKREFSPVQPDWSKLMATVATFPATNFTTTP